MRLILFIFLTIIFVHLGHANGQPLALGLILASAALSLGIVAFLRIIGLGGRKKSRSRSNHRH